MINHSIKVLSLLSLTTCGLLGNVYNPISQLLEEEVSSVLTYYSNNPITFNYAYEPLISQEIEVRDAIIEYGSWKRNITSTVFWVGEDASQNNPVHNKASSWDPKWAKNFGGTDHPKKRDGHNPQGFIPSQTPFYIALPYNDMTKGKHKPEASKVIPWFWEQYKGPTKSVCHGSWLALHKNGTVCYAKWRDAGPFTTTDWKYVFGDELPLYNRNASAGIDISPAVRDYLSMTGLDSVDWKFVPESEVPAGPWKNWN